jgi:hypothetical protein
VRFEPLGVKGPNRNEHGPHDALGRDRIAAGIIGVADQHAAEILRPWAVKSAVVNHVACPLGRNSSAQGGKVMNASMFSSAKMTFGSPCPKATEQTSPASPLSEALFTSP